MTDLSERATCDENTQQFTIHLPCSLAKRIEKYANETGDTVTGVVIEALDAFLRGRTVD
jgi:predicted DNA-binding protein